MYKISACKYVKSSHENVNDNVHIVIIYVHIHIRETYIPTNSLLCIFLVPKYN